MIVVLLYAENSFSDCKKILKINLITHESSKPFTGIFSGPIIEILRKAMNSIKKEILLFKKFKTRATFFRINQLYYHFHPDQFFQQLVLLVSPGIVIMSPHTITINSAPAANLTSLIVITWSDGAPLKVGSVENEY